MTATNVYNSAVFASLGAPTLTRSTNTGLPGDFRIVTMPTTSIDEANDFYGFFPVPEGRTIRALFWNFADLDTHATPTLDLDIILRVYNSAGTATDTVLLNSGTTFQAAAQGWKILAQIVSGSAKGYGIIGTKVVAAAATAAAVECQLGALWE